MEHMQQSVHLESVAPRMGSVGWNKFAPGNEYKSRGRSPYGERGLEYDRCGCIVIGRGRSPYGERGLELIMLERIFARRLVAPRLGSVGWNLLESNIWLDESSRSPHGERGLEYDEASEPVFAFGVAPRMGSVGGNPMAGERPAASTRRSPHGERGLESPSFCSYAVVIGRSPHGERGLRGLTLGLFCEL